MQNLGGFRRLMKGGGVIVQTHVDNGFHGAIFVVVKNGKSVGTFDSLVGAQTVFPNAQIDGEVVR